MFCEGSDFFFEGLYLERIVDLVRQQIKFFTLWSWSIVMCFENKYVNLGVFICSCVDHLVRPELYFLGWLNTPWLAAERQAGGLIWGLPGSEVQEVYASFA